jgi:NADPH-dependent 2,4-dienoyl-CoA reductase/sulfur reductase-like enzyme/rhodanese-related sulfurtransferase
MSPSDDLRIVIIGGVACGPKAAARARRRDGNARITVLETGKDISYAACGMPFYLAGVVPNTDPLQSTPAGTLRDVGFFEKIKDVQVRTSTQATSIDRDAKTVDVTDLATNETETLAYDKLVLATGATPIRPPIDGIDLKRVFSLRNLEQAREIRGLIDEMAVDHVTIIGAGRVAVEVADALMAQAVDCAIVEMADRALPTALDADMASLVERGLRDKGIQVMTSTRVQRIEGDDDGVARKVITDSGEIETGMVLVATGVRPNTELAEKAGLALGDTGAIAVNDYLQTSDPDIYAGGDCVECRNVVTGKPAFAPLGSTANRHGRVIGDNVTGGATKFSGIVGTGIMKTMGLDIATTGLTESEATRLGHKVVTGTANGHDRSHFYPGGKITTIKLIADAEDGRLLGAQIVGAGEACKSIDVVASALAFGRSVAEVADLDLAYAPPFGGPIANVSHAANVIRNKIEGIANTISIAEVKARLAGGEDLLFVDVRSASEVEKNPFTAGDVMAVPLGALRARAGELPRDRQLVCVCPLGIRAYEASRILHAAGLADTKFMEGGTTCFA